MIKDRVVIGGLAQLVMLAILRLEKDKTWGMNIQRDIGKTTGYYPAAGALYVTLERLEHKGFVQSRMGNNVTPTQGGRATRLFVLTVTGRAALSKSLVAIRKMCEGGVFI